MLTLKALSSMKLARALFVASTFLMSFFAFSQNLPEAMENQCRSEAKEIALKAYESCITVKKSEQIEHLRKEYQARLLEIKNEYDQKIKDLATSPSLNESETVKPQPTPTQKLNSSQIQKITPKKTNTSSHVNHTEPTIKLKKAKPVAKSKKRSSKNESLIKEAQSNQMTQEEVMTARVEEEINSVTGEIEKLEVQEMGQ